MNTSIFLDFQGQLTRQSLNGSGQVSKSFEIFTLFSLPVKMKKIRSKMKALVLTT